MIKGRLARAAALTTLLLLAGAGTAAAAPAGNAAFLRAGVQVYPDDAVGVGCSALGFCDGVAAQLSRSATPRYLSLRAGEAVLVTCRSADLARVTGFFGTGEDLVTGWSNAGGLQISGGDPVPACGTV